MALRPGSRLSISTSVLILLLSACGGPSTSGGSGSRMRLDAKGQLVVRVDGYLAPGEYLRQPLGPDGREGVILLEGARGVTLDLGGVVLRGTPRDTDLDENEGWGIVLRDCEDVTLRGGTFGGYRGCVVVEGSRRVTLEDMSFEGWYGQELRSTLAAEDPSDWLWPHDNDAGEWISKYGAAISFTDCEEVTVRRCRGRRGQNGILMTRTTGGQIYDNDFSFMSGWGLGMYRSSGNTVSHNIFDYCVRGYSHGVYSRGQDSAGILMFERCCDNVVAFNSATHSGDGIFLFAGHDIVKGNALARGESDIGGSDRNLFYKNDLRYSPANAFEGTFSNRNLVVENDLSGCYQHGIWGGYSSEMLILRNKIDDTQDGAITIEHGQDCVIAENTMRRNDKGVELYWDADPDFVDGPYGEQRDTASRDHWVLSNQFENNTQDLVIKETTGLSFFDNDWMTNGRAPYVDALSAEENPELDVETVRGWLADREGTEPTGHIAQVTLRDWTGRYPALLDEFGAIVPPDAPGEREVGAEERGVATGDRSTIVVGRWGPWDFRSGDARPEPRRPGGILSFVRWDARWFRWTKDTDPRGDVDVWRALADSSVVEKTVSNWMSPWADDDVRAVVGNDRFGLIANATVPVAESGLYELTVISDDGVRVLIDGETVFEDWSWHAVSRGQVEVQLEAGDRELTLEYFQIDGGVALSIDLEKAE